MNEKGRLAAPRSHPLVYKDAKPPMGNVTVGGNNGVNESPAVKPSSGEKAKFVMGPVTPVTMHEITLPSHSAMRLGYEINRNGSVVPPQPLPGMSKYYAPEHVIRGNKDINQSLSWNPIRRPAYNVTRKTKEGKWDIDSKFQKDVQKYIKSLHPKLRLPELNKLQQSCPFLIADPAMKKLKKNSSVSYGYADLMRFLGWNYDASQNIIKSSENPLYFQIKYPFPDVYGNVMLAQMKNMSDYGTILADLNNQLDSVTRSYKKDPKKNRVKRNKAYVDIFNTAYNIIEQSTNPVSLSKFIVGQERPMYKYQKDNFYNTLLAFNQLHKMHPASKGKKNPKKTKISLKDKRLK